MAAVHHFTARVVWQGGGDGTAWGNHRIELAGRPAIDMSAASQYRGDPSRANPEELMVASLASCQALSYLALASRAGIAVRTYEDEGTGTLTIADKRMRFTEVVLRPRITLAPGSDEAKARALVEAAHDGCFIANSVSCAVRVEAEVSTAAA